MNKRITDRRTFLSTVGAGLAAGALTTIPATAKRRGFPPERHTTWGESGSIGDGEIQSFVTTNPAGHPVFVGAYFTDAELEGLPGGTEHHHINLDLPQQNPTNFEFLEYDWNPAGHPPPDIYTVPHFDWHFYTMAESAVENIEFSDDPTMVPPDQQPIGYFPDQVVVPHMGLHWFDATAPEWNGESFTHTYIYGSYEGDLHFVEPMITKAFLEEEYEEVRTPVATPQAFPESGWYPTEYVIRYLGNQDAYTVTLEAFERFPASTSGSG